MGILEKIFKADNSGNEELNADDWREFQRVVNDLKSKGYFPLWKLDKDGYNFHLTVRKHKKV